MAPHLPARRVPPIAFAQSAGGDAGASTTPVPPLGAAGVHGHLWRTADGVPVVGPAGGRVRTGGLGRRAVVRLRAAELPPGVPELSALLAGTAHVLVDLEDLDAAPEAIALARDLGREERLWLAHEELAALADLRDLSPAAHLVLRARLARLTRRAGGVEAAVARAAAAGVDALLLPGDDWSAGYITLVHRFDCDALADDARHDRVIGSLLRAGIDALVSTDVDRLVDAIARAYPAGA